MKYYLSSYKFGSKFEELKRLRPENIRIGHINNSRDWIGADPVRAANHQKEEIDFLNSLGFNAEPLDLKLYFDNKEALREKIYSLGALWVSGGNAFVLRMAMRLSGFDAIFDELRFKNEFLYGGYSAGICVLSNSLKAIAVVDDPANFPYKELKKPIYEGLGAFSYSFLPHYDSDHFESEAIGEEIQRCIENKWLFKALRDGDVIIEEGKQ